MYKPKPPCILYLASYPPRECGIATFTQDLTNAIDREFNPEIKSKILAINDNGTSIYNYPRKVVRTLSETAIEEYLNRAHEINRMADVKLVNIQHEYGLFGGDQGEFLIPFLELLQKPVIVTMHTVLPLPGEKMKKVCQQIAERSLGIVVMTNTGKQVLQEVYGIKPHKIHVIPHGVHHISYPSKSRAKKKLQLQGRLVLSTFGMISRDKGIEYAIEALPDIVARHPNVLYLIIGATHPVVRRQEGEDYRNYLKELVEKHKLEEHVKFYNKYLDLPELIEFLKATDIYIYPMLSREQASSGSLSYALSCACPAIATASQYARSVLNEERGRLVGFKSSEEIRAALQELVPNKRLQRDMGKNAYLYTRFMTWPNVALSYFQLFNQFAKIQPRDKTKLPAIKLDYLRVLTDNFGMIQFANHTKPDKHSGYCVDDNARALLGTIAHYELTKRASTLPLIQIYLSFLKFTKKGNGKFHNFVSHGKIFTDRGADSEDSFGRALIALGYTASSAALPEADRKLAATLLKKALPWIKEIKSPRAIAFALIGLTHAAKRGTGDLLPAPETALIRQLIQRQADKLLRLFTACAKRGRTGEPDWLWFEDCLTYSNFKLPESLFRAYAVTGDERHLDVASQSLKFLTDITFENTGYFTPIGQDGWFFRNGQRAYFDQQPEDAATAVDALAAAFAVTDDKAYADMAQIAFQWFLGKNHLHQMVYDEVTGGCYDGLGKNSLNFNQGAESTISYFLARLAMEQLK